MVQKVSAHVSAVQSFERSRGCANLAKHYSFARASPTNRHHLRKPATHAMIGLPYAARGRVLFRANTVSKGALLQCGLCGGPQIPTGEHPPAYAGSKLARLRQL